MADVLTALLFIAPIAVVFGMILTNKKVYKFTEELLNRIFETL